MSSHSDQKSGERSSRSIREVLELLREEFPDVTVSKIRFLESRGLIQPQRTASGYRKFDDEVIERLRWILRQQREHFLPLKVIKGRLEQGVAGPVASSLFDEDFDPDPDDDADIESSASRHPSLGEADPFAEEEVAFVEESSVSVEIAPEPVSESPPPAPHRRSPKRAPQVEPAGQSGLSAEALATTAACDLGLVFELDEYGLLPGEGRGEGRVFTPDALEIVKVALRFRGFGVEPRHLRTFKHAAERDAGVFAQVITPMLQVRNPEARQRARAELGELVQLGAAMHHAFVTAALDGLRRE